MLSQGIDVIDHITTDSVKLISSSSNYQRIIETLDEIFRGLFVERGIDQTHLITRSISSMHIKMKNLIVIVERLSIKLYQGAGLFRSFRAAIIQTLWMAVLSQQKCVSKIAHAHARDMPEQPKHINQITNDYVLELC